MRLNSTLRRRSWLWFSTAGFAACALIGCNSEPDVITAKNSKYEVADGKASSASTESAASGQDKSRSVTGTPSKDFNSAAGAASIPEAGQPAGGQVGDAPTRPSSTPPPGVQSAAAQSPVPPLDRKDPKQLVVYMQQLMKQEPRGTTNEEKLSRFEAAQREAIETANAILELPADEMTQRRAAEGKIQALSTLIQLGRKEAANDLRVFLANLAKSENGELARLGRRMAFAQQMDTFANSDSGDPAKLLKDFEALFADESRDAGLFYLGNQVASMFLQKNQNAAALTVMKFTRDAYVGNSDAEIAKAARSLGEQVLMVELDINAKLSAFLQEAPNSEQNLLEALNKVLSAKDLGMATFDMVRQIAPMLESQNLDAAAKVYDQMRKAFEKNPDPQIAEAAIASVEMFSKRKAIIGQPFVVEGLTLNGSPFDWAKYRGKVVLVDFWATWCGPCLREIPNIRANYEQYHDQGFEVVGVNLDDDVQVVQQFFAVQKPVPWATVTSPDPNNAGMKNPLATKCGVEMIPFLVLVGRDGKAITLNARGEELGKQLAELFKNDPPAKVSPATGNGKTSQVTPKRAGIMSSFVAVGLTSPEPAFPDQAQQSGSDNGNKKENKKENEKENEKEKSLGLELDDSNPYLAAPGLNAAQLVEFILEMQDKPGVIQKRPGFTAAIAEAADRILAFANATDKQQRLAILAKASALHRAAETGDAEADKQLIQLAEKFQADTRDDVAREVRFIQVEQAALSAAKLPREEIPTALEAIKKYVEKETLSARHLRLASSVVEAINRLSDEDFRENRFQEFGKLFAKSDNKELARYGNRLSETPDGAVGQWVGKPLELTGTTVLGTSFDWSNYRGKVVVIDFWATWCGPCRAEFPVLKELHDKLAVKGFDVVGISVDKDTEALAKFLGENEMPWTNLAGQDAMDVARRLGVRGLPTMLLVDQTGRIVSVSHAVAELAGRVESLLAKASN